MRKYIWDYEFFSRQEPQVAFWAGILFADGNISNNTVALKLTEKDEVVVRALAATLGCNADAVKRGPATIYTYPDGAISYGKPVSYFRFSHPLLPQQLAPWGVTERKTYSFTSPNILPSLLPHFLRGVLMADGSCGYRKNRTGYTLSTVEFSGSRDEIYWIANQVASLGFEPVIYHRVGKRGSWSRLCLYGTENNKRFLRSLLPGEADAVLMPRKFNLDTIYSSSPAH